MKGLVIALEESHRIIIRGGCVAGYDGLLLPSKKNLVRRLKKSFMDPHYLLRTPVYSERDVEVLESPEHTLQTLLYA
jgi:hypothetical protein